MSDLHYEANSTRPPFCIDPDAASHYVAALAELAMATFQLEHLLHHVNSDEVVAADARSAVTGVCKRFAQCEEQLGEFVLGMLDVNPSDSAPVIELLAHAVERQHDVVVGKLSRILNDLWPGLVHDVLDQFRVDEEFEAMTSDVS